MIDVKEFRFEIVQPTLVGINEQIPYSKAAENLLVGTALQESGLVHLKQLGNGPALGFYQIEPATHKDIWKNFVSYREDLGKLMLHYVTMSPELDYQLMTNMVYATIIARLVYYRVSEPLPQADDIEALGAYWKKHYNTIKGKGKASEWVEKYKEHHDV